MTTPSVGGRGRPAPTRVDRGLKAAVRDHRIVASPCEGTKLPKIHRQRIEPVTIEAVEALTEAVPNRFQALVTLAAGTELRQGVILVSVSTASTSCAVSSLSTSS